MALSAVITADIVNSTRLSPKLENGLRNALSSVLKPYKSEFFRGDSFQVYLNDAKDALKTIFEIRTAARRIGYMYDVRASVGIAQQTSKVTSLNISKGTAFILSGHAFDDISKTGKRLLMRSDNGSFNIALEVISNFADKILTDLTSKQAEVIFELLQNHTQLVVAKNLKKSQATINKHAKSAGWSDIYDLLVNYQQLVVQLKSMK